MIFSVSYKETEKKFILLHSDCNTFFQDNCTFLWLLKEVFAENQFNSKQIIFDLKKKYFTGAGFSNIPGKYENVVFIIKNPRNRNKYVSHSCSNGWNELFFSERTSFGLHMLKKIWIFFKSHFLFYGQRRALQLVNLQQS